MSTETPTQTPNETVQTKVETPNSPDSKREFQALNASQEWLEQNRNREFVGWQRLFKGGFHAVGQLLDKITYTPPELGPLSIAMPVVEGIRTKTETSMMRTAVDPTSTAEDIKSKANRNFYASFLSILPAAGIVAFLPPVAGSVLLTGTLYTARQILRSGIAYSAKKQLEAYAENKDKSENVIKTSSSWLQSQLGRSLPAFGRYIEQGFEYGSGFVNGYFALASLFSGNLLGLAVYGTVSVYSFWKARRAVPGAIEFYNRLESYVEDGLLAGDSLPAEERAALTQIRDMEAESRTVVERAKAELDSRTRPLMDKFKSTHDKLADVNVRLADTRAAQANATTDAEKAALAGTIAALVAQKASLEKQSQETERGLLQGTGETVSQTLDRIRKALRQEKDEKKHASSEEIDKFVRQFRGNTARTKEVVTQIEDIKSKLNNHIASEDAAVLNAELAKLEKEKRDLDQEMAQLRSRVKGIPNATLTENTVSSSKDITIPPKTVIPNKDILPANQTSKITAPTLTERNFALEATKETQYGMVLHDVLDRAFEDLAKLEKGTDKAAIDRMKQNIEYIGVEINKMVHKDKHFAYPKSFDNNALSVGNMYIVATLAKMAGEVNSLVNTLWIEQLKAKTNGDIAKENELEARLKPLRTQNSRISELLVERSSKATNERNIRNKPTQTNRKHLKKKLQPA